MMRLRLVFLFVALDGLEDPIFKAGVLSDT